MKKIYIVLLLLITIFGMTSCNASKEYVVSDDLLATNTIHDEYGVFYEIFLGSFSDSNDDGIGDFQGLINRMDYLNDADDNSGKSLGIDGIWLMPIMPSPSYHKYDVRDYKDIDPKYGTLADFELFIEAANTRGIRVIIDLVLNHTSDQHPWFKAAKTAAREGDWDNKYLDYYTIVDSADRVSNRTYYLFYDNLYYEGNFSSSMPELNMDNPEVKQEIVDIVQFWYDLGVYGFRLDAAKYIYLNDTEKNLAFWNWFVETCQDIKEDTYIVGEVWSSESEIAEYYQAFSNFDFGMSQSQGAVASVAKGIDDVNWYVSYLNLYRNIVSSQNPNAILTPFISNHDMNRAAGYLNVEDYTMQNAASLYILTYGNPFIYYGEEIGMKGSRSSENTDANRRLAMLWGDKDTVENPFGSTYDEDNQTNGTVKSQLKEETSLYTHYKKLLMLRNANPEIARGTYTPLNFVSYYYFGGFLTTYQDSTVGVFHNIGNEELVIDLNVYTDYNFTLVRGFVGEGSASLNGQILTISANTSVILK